MEKKDSYKRQIIKELYFANVLSCSELSQKINKSIPLTTKILSELIGKKWVVETGLAASSGGRRPATYSLKKDVLYVVAVSMDQFVTRIALMNMQNQYLTEVREIDLPLANNSQVVQVLVDNINAVIKDSGIAKAKIAGIGIGMPGFIDVEKGINYSFPEMHDSSITRTISESTGLPVYIDNDSSLIALAELRFGAARDSKNAMIVNIGWGIGLGIVLEGKLFRGNNGFAGEFSHIPLFSNGKLCECGKRGCLETESSLMVVIDKAKEGLRNGRQSILHDLENLNVEKASEMIIKAARSGDQFAIELLSEAGYTIGRGVAILILLFNPKEIILSGRGALAGKMWQAPIQQAINDHCIPKLAAHTSIETSTLGYQAELMGAASLVMDNYEKKPHLNNHSLVPMATKGRRKLAKA